MGFAKRIVIATMVALLLFSPLFLLLETPLNVYQKALKVTYEVRAGKLGAGPQYGAGVLFNKGFLLTCRHIADLNGNGFIDDTELQVVVTSSLGNVYNGTVVLQPSESLEMADYDWCLVWVSGAEGLSKLKVAKSKPAFGDDIFTIGCPDISNAHLYVGHQSTPQNFGLERGSISSFPGNSGGGVFNSRGEVIGLIDAVKIARWYETTMIVPQWSEYVSIFSIKEQLDEAGCSKVLD